MTGTKKVASSQERDHKKPPLDNIKIYKNSHLNSSHHGRRNRIPSPAEMINGYMVSAKFFSGREQYHKDALIWYLNESKLMLEKADKERQKAAVCADNYSQYLHLAGVATLKNMGVNVHD